MAVIALLVIVNCCTEEGMVGIVVMLLPPHVNVVKPVGTVSVVKRLKAQVSENKDCGKVGAVATWLLSKSRY